MSRAPVRRASPAALHPALGEAPQQPRSPIGLSAQTVARPGSGRRLSLRMKTDQFTVGGN